MGTEPRLQQRVRVAAHRLADQGRCTPGATLQVLSAAASAAEPGLVQGLPEPHRCGPGPQPAHPRGTGAREHERRASARLAEVVMSAGAQAAAPRAGVAPVDLNDIQGLMRFGYKHHTQACYLLLRIKDRAAARAWLAQAPVDSAVGGDPLPQTVLQVAFTCE